jgi:hypothetical protein
MLISTGAVELEVICGSHVFRKDAGGEAFFEWEDMTDTQRGHWEDLQERTLELVNG